MLSLGSFRISMMRIALSADAISQKRQLNHSCNAYPRKWLA